MDPDLLQFLQDWAAMWRDEVGSQASDSAGSMLNSLLFKAIPPIGTLAPSGIPGHMIPDVMEALRATMALWADALAEPPSAEVPGRDPAAPPGAQAAAAAFGSRDAEVERLTRRIDELESRLAKLEIPRRHRR